jgi:hypothetical protein
MGRYRVTVTFRGHQSFEVDAATEQEAEDLAVGQWEASPAAGGEHVEILSIKSQPASDRPKAERIREPRVVSVPQESTAGKASEATIEAEVTSRGEETPVAEPERPAFQPPLPSKRSLLPYLWTAFWIGVLILLAQLGNR